MKSQLQIIHKIKFNPEGIMRQIFFQRSYCIPVFGLSDSDILFYILKVVSITSPFEERCS